ncbi:hypothetical protein PV797_19620 [Clostridiaceae bacterium M8S5]|nr:hypothetical protein PV797_19620 [Clostridiaceae bacterium M8S5]
MKKKILLKHFFVVILFISIVYITFKYTYHWHVIKKIPENNFNRLTIYEFHTKKTLNIDDTSTINTLYNYLFDRRCVKVNKLLKTAYPYDGNCWYIDFKNDTSYMEVKLLSPEFISIDGDYYYLDDSFDFDEFRKIIQR